MAENFRRVESGDLIAQEAGECADVYVCVLADEEVFVLARPKIQLRDDGVTIVGYKRDNCKVYDNNAETMKKNHFEILD